MHRHPDRNNPAALAPELITEHWFNSPAPVTLQSLRGRVVVIEAFQMLCPGCVAHGLPQARRVHDTFDRDKVAVIGLHCVFEHHLAQGSVEALAAFVHEYRIPFPVGLDAPSDDQSIPQTMAAYQLRGTPTLLLIDQQGRLRRKIFGPVEDLVLGAEIMALLNDAAMTDPGATEHSVADQCDGDGCVAK